MESKWTRQLWDGVNLARFNRPTNSRHKELTIVLENRVIGIISAQTLGKVLHENESQLRALENHRQSEQQLRLRMRMHPA